MSGTLRDTNRIYDQISLSSKIYIYIIYISYKPITLYVGYYIHTIIDYNYGRGVQRSECP